MPNFIRHLLPFDNENRWSDLLALLIERDAHAAAMAFEWSETGSELVVTREAQGEGKDRIDLVVRSSDTLVAVIEVKVIGVLGRHQLERYGRALVGAQRYALVFPHRLPVTATGVWQPITWESALAAFAASSDEWVAETAIMWREHLESSLPRVKSATVWNEFVADENFPLAVRARCSWVYNRLNPPQGVDLVIIQSGAGVSSVVKMSAQAAGTDYLVAIEFEERLDSREWPSLAPKPAPKVKGPSVKVCLVQTGVDTSAGFDWDYLLALWPTMAAARSDWVAEKPRPRAAHDKEGYQRMVAAGGPSYLGIGFGDAQAAKSHDCMFGARFQLPADITLGELVIVMKDLEKLLQDLALVPPPVGATA
jgi:hypothetical protein